MGRGCLGERSDFFPFVPVWPTRHRADRWCCYTLGLLVQKVPSCPILPHSSWLWRIMFLMESSTAPPVLSAVGCEERPLPSPGVAFGDVPPSIPAPCEGPPCFKWCSHFTRQVFFDTPNSQSVLRACPGSWPA